MTDTKTDTTPTEPQHLPSTDCANLLLYWPLGARQNYAVFQAVVHAGVPPIATNPSIQTKQDWGTAERAHECPRGKRERSGGNGTAVPPLPATIGETNERAVKVAAGELSAR